MTRERGFTLLEILISTAILSGGLIAVASLFSFSISTNVTNQQRTVATLLLCGKMEQFNATPLSDPMWTPGGGLDMTSPVAAYFDYDSIGTAGSLTTSATNSTLPYLRLWQVSGTVPRSVTIVVVVNRSGLTRRALELIRATTATGLSF